MKATDFLIACLFFGALFLFYPATSQALYGDGCEQYGPMAYSSGGYCKCISGYVFDDGIGGKYCTDANIVCHQKLGYSSRYDSLSGSCECDYGYVLSGGQCKSKDSVCRDQLGFGARYSSLSGSCECGYGDVISGGRCTSGDLVCHSKHGLYSSYDDLSNSCECDNGYTFDSSNQCVEKQNNVYFKLLDIDTTNRQAIIKSDYDSRQYLVSYGSGCLSIERYLSKRLVINLGTDYEVDRWDTIVLQDYGQTCNIVTRERTYEDSFPDPEEDEDYSSYYYVPTAPVTPVKKSPSLNASLSQEKENATAQDITKVTSSTDSTTTDASFKGDTKPGFWSGFLSWFKGWF